MLHRYPTIGWFRTSNFRTSNFRTIPFSTFRTFCFRTFCFRTTIKGREPSCNYPWCFFSLSDNGGNYYVKKTTQLLKSGKKTTQLLKSESTIP